MFVIIGVIFEIDDFNDYFGKICFVVFIGNYQIEFDVFMLGCMFFKYCSVIVKLSLKYLFFFGWFMRFSGFIFIDCKNFKDVCEVMKGVVEEIQRKKQSVFMFFEGICSYVKEFGLLLFKKGVFYFVV